MRVRKPTSDVLKQRLSTAYDQAHAALWAALMAFLIYFAIWVVPNLRQAQKQAEAEQILAAVAQHDDLCSSLGMGRGTAGYQRCVAKIQIFRAEVEKQFIDEAQLDGI